MGARRERENGGALQSGAARPFAPDWRRLELVPPPSEQRLLDVQNRFLRDFLDDRSSGRSRSLEEYQAAYPDCADAVAEEYRRLVSGEASDDGEEEWIASFGRELGPYRLESVLGRSEAVVDERFHGPSLLLCGFSSAQACRINNL